MCENYTYFMGPPCKWVYYNAGLTNEIKTLEMYLTKYTAAKKTHSFGNSGSRGYYAMFWANFTMLTSKNVPLRRHLGLIAVCNFKIYQHTYWASELIVCLALDTDNKLVFRSLMKWRPSAQLYWLYLTDTNMFGSPRTAWYESVTSITNVDINLSETLQWQRRWGEWTSTRYCNVHSACKYYAENLLWLFCYIGITLIFPHIA